MITPLSEGDVDLIRPIGFPFDEARTEPFLADAAIRFFSLSELSLIEDVDGEFGGGDMAATIKGGG